MSVYSLKEFMIFGVDPHQANLAELLNTALQATEETAQNKNAEAQLHTYALIDGVFDKNWGVALLWQQSQAVKAHYVRSLYTESRLKALEECAPFLVIVDHDNRVRMLENLLARTDGKPMLTFVQSPLDLFTLQKHLMRFSQVETPDTLIFPLRFADTICFPVIFGAFSESQRADLMGGVAAWHIINRSGGITTFAGTCFDVYVQPTDGQPDCITFTDAQFTSVVDGAEVDTIFKEIVTSNSLLNSNTKASVLIGQLQVVLDEMDKRQIVDEKERKELACVSLTLHNAHTISCFLDIAQRQGLETALASL